MSIQIISPLVSKGGKKKEKSLVLPLQPVFCIRERRPRLVSSAPPAIPVGNFSRRAGSGHSPGRRRWASDVLLSRAEALTPRRACLFKFQLRCWETAPPAARRRGWQAAASSLALSLPAARRGGLARPAGCSAAAAAAAAARGGEARPGRGGKKELAGPGEAPRPVPRPRSAAPAVSFGGDEDVPGWWLFFFFFSSP